MSWFLALLACAFVDTAKVHSKKGEGQILAAGAGVFYLVPLHDRIRLDVSMSPGWVWGEQTLEGTEPLEDGALESWEMRGRWDVLRLRLGLGVGGSILRVGGHLDVDRVRRREVVATLGPWSEQVQENDDLVWSAGVGGSVLWAY